MAQSLFPTFEPIDDVVEQPAEEQLSPSSVYFDFESGDFAVNAVGKTIQADPATAWAQWCGKQLHTQRYAFLSYSPDIGVEAAEALQEPTREARESYLRRTIIEALMADPLGRTQLVQGFSFDWNEPDGVIISFEIEGRNMETQTITKKIGV